MSRNAAAKRRLRETAAVLDQLDALRREAIDMANRLTIRELEAVIAVGRAFTAPRTPAPQDSEDLDTAIDRVLARRDRDRYSRSRKATTR